MDGFVHPIEAGDEYQTIAGYFGAILNRVPTEGDIIKESGWIFEIVDMDGIRVDKVIASVDPDAPKSEKVENPEEIPIAGV